MENKTHDHMVAIYNDPEFKKLMDKQFELIRKEHELRRKFWDKLLKEYENGR